MPTSRNSFPTALRGAALPYFVDWLIENVHLVEITAYSDGDAYTIFETMNDRGLSLTPADMLKGYLLANITDADNRPMPRRSGSRERMSAPRTWARTKTPTASSPGCAANTRRPSANESAALLHRTSTSSEPSSTAGCAITRISLGLRRAAISFASSSSDFAFYGHWYERLAVRPKH